MTIVRRDVRGAGDVRVTELTVATCLNRERVTVCPHCESLTVGVWGGHWSIALVETHSNKRSRS